MGSPNMVSFPEQPPAAAPRRLFGKCACLAACLSPASLAASGRKSGCSHRQFKLPRARSWPQAAAASAPLWRAA
eukprot:2733475-Alexandrium_andersonii.AAC.1